MEQRAHHFDGLFRLNILFYCCDVTPSCCFFCYIKLIYYHFCVDKMIKLKIKKNMIIYVCSSLKQNGEQS